MFHLLFIKGLIGIVMVSNIKSLERKFVVFGDSIGFGQHVKPHLTWIHMFSKFLGELKYINFTLQNSSINGNTTRQALERFMYDVASKKPFAVLIQFGINDCNCWDSDNGESRVSEEAFEANLKELVVKSLAAEISLIFLSTNHLGLKGSFIANPKFIYSERILFYNKIIKKVFKNLKKRSFPVELIDNEKMMNLDMSRNKLQQQDYLLDDKIHLNERGHILYFNTISSIFSNVIKNYCKES